MYYDASDFTISGNVGATPELRFTQTGKAVLNLRVAKYQGPDNEPQWFDVVVWEDLAENAAQSITKGDRVTVTGRFELRYWKGEDGVTRTTPTVTAADIGLSLRWNPARSVRTTKQQAPVVEEQLPLDQVTEEVPF